MTNHISFHDEDIDSHFAELNPFRRLQEIHKPYKHVIEYVNNVVTGADKVSASDREKIKADIYEVIPKQQRKLSYIVELKYRSLSSFDKDSYDAWKKVVSSLPLPYQIAIMDQHLTKIDGVDGQERQYKEVDASLSNNMDLYKEVADHIVDTSFYISGKSLKDEKSDASAQLSETAKKMKNQHQKAELLTLACGLCPHKSHQTWDDLSGTIQHMPRELRLHYLNNFDMHRAQYMPSDNFYKSALMRQLRDDIDRQVRVSRAIIVNTFAPL